MLRWVRTIVATRQLRPHELSYDTLEVQRQSRPRHQRSALALEDRSRIAHASTGHYGPLQINKYIAKVELHILRYCVLAIRCAFHVQDIQPAIGHLQHHWVARLLTALTSYIAKHWRWRRAGRSCEENVTLSFAVLYPIRFGGFGPLRNCELRLV